MSFLNHKNPMYRNTLFYSYASAFVLNLIYLIWFCFFSGRVDNTAGKLCDWFDDWLHWDGCQEAVNDFLWVFVGIYLFIVVMLRLYCVRILYYYAKEAEQKKDDQVEGANYESLPGDSAPNNNSYTLNGDNTHANGQPANEVTSGAEATPSTTQIDTSNQASGNAMF